MKWEKIHYYLGADLDYTKTGKMTVSMIPYITKIINEFTEKIMGTPATPGSSMYKVTMQQNCYQKNKL